MKTLLSKYVIPFNINIQEIVAKSNRLKLHPIYAARWYQFQEFDLDTDELIFGSSQLSELTFRIPASHKDLLMIRHSRTEVYQYFKEVKYDCLAKMV